MCDRNCSTNCISVNKSEHYWEINPYQCIQCGYCITVCPKKCLSMNPNYTAAAPEKVVSHFDVPGPAKNPRNLTHMAQKLLLCPRAIRQLKPRLHVTKRQS